MGRKCRNIATLSVVFTLCAAAILEQLGHPGAPQYFIVIATAVITEYIVEYWQGHKDVDS